MTSDILKRAAEVEWMPCPLCGAELQAEGDGVEHPASDTCPLDSLWLLPEHSAAWNKRIPDMAAAIAERDVEIERLTARAEAADAETLEQARLLGMGAERELALMAKADRWERMADRLMNALSLARNRLQSVTVEFQTGTEQFYRIGEWADEASSTIAAMKEGR